MSLLYTTYLKEEGTISTNYVFSLEKLRGRGRGILSERNVMNMFMHFQNTSGATVRNIT
jgi:hypothetical protein